MCVCVCVRLCVDRLGCTMIIRIHNGFDSGALEQWTQHMPRETTGWLTGYLTGWFANCVHPANKFRSFNSNRLCSGCKAHSVQPTGLYCIRQGHKSELLVCSQSWDSFCCSLASVSVRVDTVD